MSLSHAAKLYPSSYKLYNTRLKRTRLQLQGIRVISIYIMGLTQLGICSSLTGRIAQWSHAPDHTLPINAHEKYGYLPKDLKMDTFQKTLLQDILTITEICNYMRNKKTYNSLI